MHTSHVVSTSDQAILDGTNPRKTCHTQTIQSDPACSKWSSTPYVPVAMGNIMANMSRKSHCVGLLLSSRHVGLIDQCGAQLSFKLSMEKDMSYLVPREEQQKGDVRVGQKRYINDQDNVSHESGRVLQLHQAYHERKQHGTSTLQKRRGGT